MKTFATIVKLLGMVFGPLNNGDRDNGDRASRLIGRATGPFSIGWHDS